MSFAQGLRLGCELFVYVCFQCETKNKLFVLVALRDSPWRNMRGRKGKLGTMAARMDQPMHSSRVCHLGLEAPLRERRRACLRPRSKNNAKCGLCLTCLESLPQRTCKRNGIRVTRIGPKRSRTNWPPRLNTASLRLSSTRATISFDKSSLQPNLVTLSQTSCQNHPVTGSLPATFGLCCQWHTGAFGNFGSRQQRFSTKLVTWRTWPLLVTSHDSTRNGRPFVEVWLFVKGSTRSARRGLCRRVICPLTICGRRLSCSWNLASYQLVRQRRSLVAAAAGPKRNHNRGTTKTIAVGTCCRSAPRRNAAVSAIAPFARNVDQLQKEGPRHLPGTSAS